MTFPDPEVFHAIIARYFRIETYMLETDDKYLVTYRGQLTADSMEAYDAIAAAVRPHGLTPIFRIEDDQHIIRLFRGVFGDDKPQPFPTTNVVLFALTLFSVMFTGAMYGYTGPMPADFTGQMMAILANLWNGWPFALSLLSILVAHEFGHYLAGRYHKTSVSLPYFIPLPLSLLGTMGAFIQLREPPRNRRILLDIGIAGPLAGLVVAIPVLLIGLWLSDTGTIKAGGLLEGNSILYLALKYVAFGQLLPAPASYGDVSPVLYWVRYFFTGQPVPVGGLDVQLHAVAWAGWAGLLVTALNLIPAGQLDGGHVLYVLFGKRVQSLLPFLIGGMVLLGFFWQGWWLWAGLLFLLGRTHAEPLDLITPLDPARRRLALAGVVLIFLVFIPVPLMGL